MPNHFTPNDSKLTFTSAGRPGIHESATKSVASQLGMLALCRHEQQWRAPVGHRALLVFSMNDTAAAALRFGTEPLYGGVELSEELREIVDAGLTVREGAVLFAGFHETLPAKAGQVASAIERMGWHDLTGYECQHNSFHLEDDSMRQGDVNEDGVPRISEADQVTLLRRGLLVAKHVCDLARNLAEPVPVRCIIGAGETNGTFRFHRLRDGEHWISSDLDAFRLEKIVLADSWPPIPVPPRTAAFPVLSQTIHVS
jgi:hypothetical protein